MTAASLSPEVCFIDRLSEADRNSLLLLGRVRTYSGRSIVFFEDDESGSVFVVRSGLVKLSLVVDDHEVVLDLLGPGDVLGEISAIDGLVRGATATTLIEVELCVIPATAFMEFVAERPAVMLELVRSIAGRLRSASRRQVESGALDANGPSVPTPRRDGGTIRTAGRQHDRDCQPAHAERCRRLGGAVTRGGGQGVAQHAARRVGHDEPSLDHRARRARGPLSRRPGPAAATAQVVGACRARVRPPVPRGSGWNRSSRMIM